MNCIRSNENLIDVISCGCSACIVPVDARQQKASEQVISNVIDWLCDFAEKKNPALDKFLKANGEGDFIDELYTYLLERNFNKLKGE